MLLRDVKAGEIYAVMGWGGRDLRNGYGHFDSADWERVGKAAEPVLALAVGVPVQGYRRSGVTIRYLERDTLQPRLIPARGPRMEAAAGPPTMHESGVLAVNLVAPWHELHAAYHDWLDERVEARERAEVERKREQARRTEEAARRWMAEEFERARRDIEQVMEVVNGEPGRTADDDEIRGLVDLRHPDGNPYLNGTFTVH